MRSSGIRGTSGWRPLPRDLRRKEPSTACTRGEYAPIVLDPQVHLVLSYRARPTCQRRLDVETGEGVKKTRMDLVLHFSTDRSSSALTRTTKATHGWSHLRSPPSPSIFEISIFSNSLIHSNTEDDGSTGRRFRYTTSSLHLRVAKIH